MARAKREIRNSGTNQKKITLISSLYLQVLCTTYFKKMNPLNTLIYLYSAYYEIFIKCCDCFYKESNDIKKS